MKKTLAIFSIFTLLSSSPIIYAGVPLPAPNPDAGSFEHSTQESSGSTAPSSEVSGRIFLAGAIVIGVSAVVGSTILTVRASKVKRERILRLQDQIYLADGKDYRELLNFFELDDRDLIKANDDLVADGYQIASDQDAVDYLVALIRKLAERSQKIPHQLQVL